MLAEIGRTRKSKRADDGHSPRNTVVVTDRILVLFIAKDSNSSMASSLTLSDALIRPPISQGLRDLVAVSSTTPHRPLELQTQ